MARKRKSRSVERPDIESRKLDKALAAALTTEAKGARAVWEEDRTCRRQLSKLKRSKNPNAAEIAKTEVESLKKQATIMSGFGGQRVMGGGGGWGPLSKFDLPVYVETRPGYTATILACSEQVFRPESARVPGRPYARNTTNGLPFTPSGDIAPGVDGVMISERRNGNLMAECKIFGTGASLNVEAGFWIDFRLDVPFNLEAFIQGGAAQRPLRFGDMRISAIFFPLLTAWEVGARELWASSSGSIRMAVFAYPDPLTVPNPLWLKIPLWQKSADDTGEYNPIRDKKYEERRVFMSPWFEANSHVKYSAYVGVSVEVQGDFNPQDHTFGFAFGSIGGELSRIKIEQCLTP